MQPPLYVNGKHVLEVRVKGSEEYTGEQVDLYLSKDGNIPDGEQPIQPYSMKPATVGNEDNIVAIDESVLKGWLEKNVKEDDAFYLIAKYTKIDREDCRASLGPIYYDPAVKFLTVEPATLNTSTDKLTVKTEPDATVTLRINEGNPLNPDNPEAKDGIYTFGLKNKLRVKDTVVIEATDKAGNTSEPLSKVVSGFFNRPMLFILVVGLILFAFSLLWFLATRKKMMEMKDISRSSGEETVKIEKKH